MRKVLSYIVLCMLLTACTGNFREINTDWSGITDDDLEADYNKYGIPLHIIQQGIYFNYDYGKGTDWPFQLIQNLSADMFCGYMHDYKPHNGGSYNSDYNLQDGWNGTMWENIYAYIMPQIHRSEEQTKDVIPELYAVTKILKVEVMHRLTDYYGPVIYTNFGDPENNSKPDRQEAVYNSFFRDLDEAISLLDGYLKRKEEHDVSYLAKFDMLLDGRYESWIRFANSLRMRLALRISAVSPDKGKKEFMKALSDKYGVWETADEIVCVSTKKEYINPLGTISRIWKEAYMNASMESILNGYEDPRREMFFDPCQDDVLYNGETCKIKGEYHGIRQGTCFAHTLYASHSMVRVEKNTDAILMTAAEIWFLRAEAALRGWSDENAGECYKQGIRTSFQQWNVKGVEEYLTSTKEAADYTDVYEPSNSIKARCRVSPCWQENASREIKLEKIITQKWIALFPEGCEAWAEQRRTGYPRLFPVKINNSPGGCIDTETMIRRLNFPGSVKSLDIALYNELVTAFGKPDNAGERLWWDTGYNFPD